MAWRLGRGWRRGRGLLCFQRIFLPLDTQTVSVLLKLGSKMALTSGTSAKTVLKIGNASEQLANLIPRASTPSKINPFMDL